MLYVNNANTTYDADIDRAVLENVQAALKTSACEYIDGTEFLWQLNGNGIADITQAERADIADVFKGSGVDYAVLVQVEPFVRKEKVTVILITHYMEEVIHADRVYVMDSGNVVMQGNPKEIFSQVDTLKAYGLDVPQVTLLAYELKKSGVDVPDGILTTEELVSALCQSN